MKLQLNIFILNISCNFLNQSLFMTLVLIMNMIIMWMAFCNLFLFWKSWFREKLINCLNREKEKITDNNNQSL